MKIFPAVFASSMIVVVVAFPNPGDLRDALNWMDRPTVADFSTETPTIETLPTRVDFRDGSPEYTYRDFEALGCTAELENASASKLEVCAAVIAEAVMQVTKFETDNGVRTTTAERLMLAATHVCRASWAEGNNLSIDFQNPACATSTLRLASLN